MTRFCFVVLHYQNEDMTNTCIDCLLRYTESPIVVVDNASPNGSGVSIRDRYSANSRVNVLLNEKNLGFAKGNNVGFQYAKTHHCPDFVVVMNNDVVIEEGFEDRIAAYMLESDVDVCGPDIVTLSGVHQNPLLPAKRTTLFYCKMVLISAFRLLCINLKPLSGRIIEGYGKAGGKNLEQRRVSVPGDDFVLHGSCVVYNNRYLMSEDFAFLPVTRLYGEEEILADYLSYKGYKAGICDSARVTHFCGQSTSSSNMLDKYRFRIKNELRAYCQLLKHRIFKY